MSCFAGSFVYADITPDYSRCVAAQKAAKKLAEFYISDDLSCETDADCSEANYFGGPTCGTKIINKYGKAGLEILKEGPEYKRIGSIIYTSQNKMECPPLPYCAQRPPGEITCLKSTKQCVFQVY